MLFGFFFARLSLVKQVFDFLLTCNTHTTYTFGVWFVGHGMISKGGVYYNIGSWLPVLLYKFYVLNEGAFIL